MMTLNIGLKHKAFCKYKYCFCNKS